MRDCLISHMEVAHYMHTYMTDALGEQGQHANICNTILSM